MSQTIEMIDPVTGEIIDQQQIAEQLLTAFVGLSRSRSGDQTVRPV